MYLLVNLLIKLSML